MGTMAQSDENKPKSSADLAMATSHGTTLSQLTKHISEMKQSQKAMLNCFNKLAKQMALLITNSTSSPKNTQPEALNLARQHDKSAWCRARGGPSACTPCCQLGTTHT